MQCHFSNRGEALAEVAAAKMMTHRTTKTTYALANQRRWGIAPGQWKARLPETTFPKSSPNTKESKEGV